MVRDYISEDYVPSLNKEQFFVDFLRDAEEATGEEMSEETDFDMPHVYEAIPSWDTLKERLNFFMAQYNEQVGYTGFISADVT